MSDVRLTRRQTRTIFAFPSGARTVFQFRPLRAHLLEVKDTHFHLDSAVLIPQFDPFIGQRPNNPTGLEALRGCYLHAKENPDDRLLIAGHTDTTGKKGYNLELSTLRCRSVRHALIGEVDPWVDIALSRHQVEDYQKILKWLELFWDWDTDPGEIDGRHGEKTDRALKEFKRTYNVVMDRTLPITAAVDRGTWAAFFDMYMETLADSLETDLEGIKEWRDTIRFLDFGKNFVGCGENFPIEEADADDFESETNRRVELLFFSPADEPKLLCHPSATVCVPEECEIHRRHIFNKIPIPPRPLPLLPVTARITEILGLYEPGHDDPADVDRKTTRSAGYRAGYTSGDDKGRIYLNHIPRADASVDWQALWKKDTQYIELTATLQPSGRKWPRYATIIWEWSDPDDPSNLTMREDASAEVDSNDFHEGTPRGATDGDNLGMCDYPKKDSGFLAQWEEIAPYKLHVVPGTKVCQTVVKDGISRVRFHATNVGGDNFRIRARPWGLMRLVNEGGDETGIMTMWKRIDVEYRQETGAVPVPVKSVADRFAPAFIQMDFMEPLPYEDKKRLAADESQTGVFTHHKKPGWFLLATVAPGAGDATTAATAPRRLYRGPGEVRAATTPQGEKMEVLIVPELIRDDPDDIHFVEAAGKAVFRATGKDLNKPTRGQTTLSLSPTDYQSDFVPGDGRVGAAGKGGAYDRREYYYPSSIVTPPGNVRHGTGFGFARAVEVAIFSAGMRNVAGISPDVKHKGQQYFAGLTMIFTGHPRYTAPAEAILAVRGKFRTGDTVTVSIDGHPVTVTAATDQAALDMAGVLSNALNADPAVNATIWALPLEQDIQIRALTAGESGNAVRLKVEVRSADGSVTAPGGTLTGGGAHPEDLLDTVVHEFGHAFGFPHKCGYNTFEAPAGKSCCMNYSVSWLYAPGTRDVQRFVPGVKTGHFCPRHLMGLRRVHLEQNPAMWTW